MKEIRVQEFGAPARAEQVQTDLQALADEGFEVASAVPAGSGYVVILQREQASANPTWDTAD